MFDRFKNILKSMALSQMSKMETPEIMAEQAESQLESELKNLMDALTSGMANEKILKDKLAKSKEEVTLWDGRAKVAVGQNNDDVAKQALQKKQSFVQEGQTLENQIAEQANINQALKQKHAQLQAKLNDFRLNKGKLIAQMKAGESTAKISELLSDSSSSGLGHWEQKINQKAARADALAEIADPGGVEGRFKDEAKERLLEDELSSIKAQVGGFKLIEEKEPPAE
ncbi:MAG: PspA/IM30 family protein [Candidatus Obscuribacterales bacterium]|nr:PspA/IM30 family protein [Candidatus Obscuribacterales bacterium]